MDPGCRLRDENLNSRGCEGFIDGDHFGDLPFVLTAFFIAQRGVLTAGKITRSVSKWSPEKPRALGMSPVRPPSRVSVPPRLAYPRGVANSSTGKEIAI